MSINTQPYKIAVLLAAYNGVQFIQEQVKSILEQVVVDVTIFISVDASSDGTESLVDELALSDSRVVVLSYGQQFGGAAPNFYRLIKEVDFTSFDYISFSDQDDFWLPAKLSLAVDAIQKDNADGYSSNVIAFWPNGEQRLINKAQSQKRWDFIFESPGPGCTFVMTRNLINKVKKTLTDDKSEARNVELHDWLIYAICRSYGGRWFIDPCPLVKYRQHQNNQFGANAGFKTKWARFIKFKSGWYRAEVAKVAQVCTRISDDRGVKNILGLVALRTFSSNIKILAYLMHARRKLSDRLFLALATLLFIF